MGKTNWLFLHVNAWRNLKLMFQFCFKISCLPFLAVYSLLLTLLSNEPCLAFVLGLVAFLHESFLIILLPLEHLQPAGSKSSPTGWPGLSERTKRWDPCSSPQIPLTSQKRAVGVNHWLQKSQWQHFHLWERSRVLPLSPACGTPLCSAMGAVVLVLFLHKVLIIAIPLPFISTEQKLPSNNLETCLWELLLA